MLFMVERLAAMLDERRLAIVLIREPPPDLSAVPFTDINTAI